MTYLRSLFINFLIVFFVNHVIPGIDIGSFEHVPNIGMDIFFAAIVGFLNSFIYPALILFDIKPTIGKIAICAFVISFGAFISIGIFNLGVRATSVSAVIIGGLLVFLVSFFTNFMETKHIHKD